MSEIISYSNEMKESVHGTNQRLFRFEVCDPGSDSMAFQYSGRVSPEAYDELMDWWREHVLFKEVADAGKSQMHRVVEPDSGPDRLGGPLNGYAPTKYPL